jgi:exopolysaccharide biosynthesis protein
MLLEDLVKRYDALGGINGGGFIDEGGGGTGGLPEGLTIVDGKSYLWKDSGASAAFDENNVLHVGTYTVESAAAAGIRDCVSFGPALIIDGAPEYGRHMESGINPRTAIGQREDGAVLMLCIDGRQIHSIGANYADLRDIMMDFGAVNACSLDGGSSTVMYFNGEYLNSPSSASGTSRYLPNAFLIKK